MALSIWAGDTFGLLLNTMKTTIKNTLFLSLIMAVMFNASCTLFGSGKKQWIPLKPGSSGFVHSVIWPDENLEIIAKWYTGKPENSVKLIEANPTVNPDKIVVGSLVFIPKDILVTTETMPRSCVEEAYKKKSSQKTNTTKKDREKKQPSTTKDEFQLFGPR